MCVYVLHSIQLLINMNSKIMNGDEALCKSMEDIKVAGDKYRSILNQEEKNTRWRHGGPPIYDVVNKLFEQGRTQEWPKGSLEEVVQNAIKSWEMELSHKTCIQDFKTVNPEKFKLIVNGRKGLSGDETLKLGSYNALLQNSLPEKFQIYNAEEESFESSHDVFRSAFPRGFAWEVMGVYSGPPLISFKFRHWGYFEGSFKGNAPTGEMVQFYGVGLLKVDELMRAEEVEIYYDPAQLFEGLLKESTTTTNGGKTGRFNTDEAPATSQGCPFIHQSSNNK